MSTGTLVAVIVAVLVLLAVLAAVVVVRRRNRRRLHERFGPEYERAVRAHDDRGRAERELRQREKRHDALDIRPLGPEARERYAREWARVQEDFVDRPDGAVHDADRLVTALMGERGYPTEGFEQQARDLSVEHGRTLEHYRAAHEVNGRSVTQQVTTEELRGAMVHYRALFDELLEDGSGPRRGNRP